MIIPEAYAPSDPSTLYSGAVEALQVDNISFASNEFVGHFYFTPRGLEQVTLEAKKQSSFDELNPVFEMVAESLREKYGKEATSRGEYGDVMNDSEITWISGKTKVFVTFMGITEHPAVLNISYQKNLDTESRFSFLIPVLLSAAVAFSFYKLISPCGRATSASELRRKWIAWMISIGTIITLPAFVRRMDIESFAIWLICVVSLAGLAFVIGSTIWLFASKRSAAKTSSTPTNVSPPPLPTESLGSLQTSTKEKMRTDQST